MRRFVACMAALAALAAGTAAEAQRGIGDPTSFAQTAALPPVEEMSGTVSDIIIDRCVATTGRVDVGARLRIETSGTGVVILHLGPDEVVANALGEVKLGSTVSFEAFRTDAMPESDYVAKTLSVDDRTIRLRDNGLRPIWTLGGGYRGGMRRAPDAFPARSRPCWW